MTPGYWKSIWMNVLVYGTLTDILLIGIAFIKPYIIMLLNVKKIINPWQLQGRGPGGPN